MQKIFGLVLDEFGNRRPNVSVKVTYPNSSALAPLWSVNDSSTQQQANPLLTDANGEYSFYPLNGRYDRQIYGGGVSTKDIEDVLAFDPIDAGRPNVNSMDGFNVTGVASGNLLWFQGSSYVDVSIETAVGDRFVRAGSATNDTAHLHVPQEGGAAVLTLTQQKSGYLQAWHVGSASGGHGSLNSYLYVDDHNLHLRTNSGALMLDGSLVVSGDLTVQGSSFIVNVGVLEVEDNTILLNRNVAGAPTLDAGIVNNRGSSADALLIWAESPDRWQWSPDNGANYYTVPGLERADTWTALQTFSGGVDLAGNVLDNPLDPTSGTHVGDRDYNDARYLQIDNVLAGDNVTVTTSANGTVTISTSGGGGVTDHGALTGLADNDHPQYLLKSGGTMTGAINMNNNDITNVNGISINDNGSDGAIDWPSLSLYESSTDNLLLNGGNLTVTGNITGLTSDRRLKHLLGEIDSGPIVDAIVPVRHTWNEQACRSAKFKHFDSAEHYSFDALQVYDVLGATVAPIAPFDRSNGDPAKSASGKNYRTFVEKELLAILWAEVRALRKRVAELKVQP